MPSRTLSRLAILRLAVLAAAACLGAAPAWAHAILMASDPAAGAAVASGPVHLVLRFNSRVDHARSSLVLTRPDGGTERLPIAPSSTVDALSTTTTLPAGAYSVRWQVLATDGHITRGDVPFTVAAPGGAAGTTTASGPTRPGQGG